MQQLSRAQSLFLFERFLWRYKLLFAAEPRTNDIRRFVIKCSVIIRRKCGIGQVMD